VEEKLIKRAAQEAVNDLELDCEVKEICRSPNGDEWCVQFNGSYSQFCDKFQDQFEQDNSPLVMREKLKRHLLKQVDKIRRSTGKTRRARSKPADAPQAGSNLLTAPLKMIGDVLGSASQVAGDVMERAAGVANAARQTVANMSGEIVPVKVEISSASSTEAVKPRRKSPALKTGKTKKAQTKRAAKTTRKASSRTDKQAKKAGKAAAKSSSKAKKAGAKTKG
jgi:hypothetical protein